MKTKWSSVFLVLLCTLLTSSAQIFYKKGAAKLVPDIFRIITNYDIVIGIILYGLGAVVLITAFKGGDLTILYPIVATSYIWVSILSTYFFNETMNIHKWLGVVVIMIGVIFVGLASKDSATAYAEVVE